MKRWASRYSGFTMAEILIVSAIIAIVAAVSVVGYIGIQRQAASTQVMSTLKDAGNAIAKDGIKNGYIGVDALPDSLKIPDDVRLSYVPLSSRHFSSLTPVQSGVLLQDICEQLAADPAYSTIHSRTGGQTSTVVMSCDDNIQHNRLQITGWDTRTWTTPVQRSDMEAYIDSVPYDSWWTDRQDVVRAFYTTMIAQYTSAGGSWPITSFWNPWANQWSGVPKQELPAPDPTSEAVNFCIIGTHVNYGDLRFVVTAKNTIPRVDECY